MISKINDDFVNALSEFFVFIASFDIRKSVEQQKRRPVKSAISIDCNQFNSLIIRYCLSRYSCWGTNEGQKNGDNLQRKH